MQRIALISEHASPLANAGSVDSGGQNVYVGQLASHLALRGFEVDVFTRRDRPGLPQVLHWAPGVRVIHVPAGPEKFVPKESMLPLMRPFGEYLKSAFAQAHRPYDVVHANFFMSGLAAEAAAHEYDIPLVMTFHALGLVRRRYQREADRFPDERFVIERRLVRSAQRIVAECPQDRDDLLLLYDAAPDSIEVVPCGVDGREIVPVDRRRARQRLGWRQNEFVVLQLGRLVPRKGIENVIRGIAALKRRGVEAKLRIVGGESEASDLQATEEVVRLTAVAESLGTGDRVEFLGGRPHSEVGIYYSAADVFVTTPWYEPFGMTPLEAMVCGTPVVGSAVGGIRSTVQHGGTGFLVHPEDPEALAERLEQLYLDPELRQRMGSMGRKRALRLFSWRQVSGRIARVYEHAIEEHRLSTRERRGIVGSRRVPAASLALANS